MELIYEELEREIKNILGESKTMVLATCADDRVTARMMSCVFDGIIIKFQTDMNFIKVKQILKNPNVALCYNNIQFEGKAEIKGAPLKRGNEEFREKFKEKFEGSYKRYSEDENEIVVEVEPTLIVLWKYEDGRPLRDYLVVSEKKAYREFYKS